jgi:ABC-type multidrug transport system fused ATPase/permease subunit
MNRPPGAAAGKGPWRLLVWAVLSDRPGLLGLGFASLGVAGCEILLPLLLASLVDTAVEGGGVAAINRLGLAMLAVVAVLYGVHVLLLRIEARLVNGGTFRLRQRLYRGVLEQPIDWFAGQRTGELVHRIMTDGEVLDSHGYYVVSELPFALITILGVVAAMAWLSWPMAIGVCLFLALSSAVGLYLGRPLPSLRKQIQEIGARLTHSVQESIVGVRALRVAGAEADQLGRLDGLNAEEMALANKEAAVGARLEPALELIELLGVVAVVWGGALLLAAQQLSPGGLVAFIAYIELLSEPMGRLGRYLRGAQTCRGILERMDGFLAQLIPPAAQGGRAQDGPLALEARRIGFRYAGAETLALAEVDLRIAPGEVVALVGPNGAGKSTLADILLGLKAATSGAALLGDVPIAEWEPRALRRALCAMPQEATVFHATLGENIALGLDATPDAIGAAVEAAGLGPLLKRLPKGLETMVGDRGTRLSGGERQRLGLARLLLRRPRVALLDEPTSSLDGRASREVSAALRLLAAEGTAVLVIAHRAETVLAADRVILLDRGRLAMQGTPGELVAGSAEFRALFPDLPAHAA